MLFWSFVSPQAGIFVLPRCKCSAEGMNLKGGPFENVTLDNVDMVRYSVRARTFLLVGRTRILNLHMIENFYLEKHWRKPSKKARIFENIFENSKLSESLMRGDSGALSDRTSANERKQGPKGCQKRSEKHFCESHAKFEMDRLVGDSNFRELVPMHLSLSNNSFDAFPVLAFVRSVTEHFLSHSSSRFWKFWIFKNIFENTSFISMVFLNVSREKNFLSCADSGTWLYPPRERFSLLQNILPCPQISSSEFMPSAEHLLRIGMDGCLDFHLGVLTLRNQGFSEIKHVTSMSRIFANTRPISVKLSLQNFPKLALCCRVNLWSRNAIGNHDFGVWKFENTGNTQYFRLFVKLKKLSKLKKRVPALQNLSRNCI